VNAILAIPLELRLLGLFLIGLALGGLVNWAIYSLAWNRRAISPWSPADAKAPQRRASDRLPVFGWLGLRRERQLHGPSFWVRPLLIELAMGVGLATLYWWEVSGGLLPDSIPQVVIEGEIASLHVQFLAHAVLFVLLMAATFIDFDEKTIPDSITVPGVLLALLLVTIWPNALLPVPFLHRAAAVSVPGPLWLTSSATHWPAWLDSWRGLLIGLAGYLSWCLAVTPATITSRRGVAKGVSFFFASIKRHGTWLQLVVLSAMGLVAIPLVWWLANGGSIAGEHWRGMLTSVVGIVLGGGLVWAIRIVASLALRKEAMGFGDVTLMAMIGALLGWQAAWLVFFLSPVAAVVVSLVNLLLTGRRDLPFGPYLALAAVFVVVRWAWLWQHYARDIFSLGWMLIAILGACLMLLMGMLMLWRIVEEALTRD